MKNAEIYCLCILAAVGFFLTGCGESHSARGKFSDDEMSALPLATRRPLPVPSGGLVLSVNTEPITVEQIISPMMDFLKPLAARDDFEGFSKQAEPVIQKVVLQKITDVLLYQQASKHIGENINDALERAVEAEVNRFIGDYGGNYAEAQKAIEKMGLDWQGFRDYQKKKLLTQAYVSQKLTDEQPVTHSELIAYYNANKARYFQWEGSMQFRLIDIVVDKIRPSQSDANDCITAEELIEKIRTGEDFADVAQQYSGGHRAAMGGLWNPVTTGSLAEPYDVLETEARKLQPGGVSAPIRADGHIFIMKLESFKDAGSESFEEVQQKIERYIKFQRQRQQLDKMLSKLIANADIHGMDEFVEFCLDSAYRKCLE